MKAKHPAPDAPTHVVMTAGDRWALCTEKDPLPVVALDFVQAHVDGHAMVVCPQCAEVARLMAEHDSEPLPHWRWIDDAHHEPAPDPVVEAHRPAHDTEWSSEQDFAGEFGQHNGFGERIE